MEIKAEKMKKRTLEIFTGLALFIIMSSPTIIFSLGYFDSDNDGIIDNQDPYPHDPLKFRDSDGDGIDDYMDAFPFDAAASKDSDSDGYPDEWNEIWNQSNGLTNLTLDAFPHNPKEHSDSDGDGIGDNADMFPHDPAASIDSDNDGYPDRWNSGMNQTDSTTHLIIDMFPFNSTEHIDSDNDGIGDNADVFPNDPNKWRNTSTPPTKIVLDKKIQLPELTNSIGITHDEKYFYILAHDEKSHIQVYRFYKNFTYTGSSWGYEIKNPVGISYNKNFLYVISNIYAWSMKDYQSCLYRFFVDGEYEDLTIVSPYVHYSSAITCANDQIFVCNSLGPLSIQIFNASWLSYSRAINITHYPSDIAVYETGNWFFIDDQTADVPSLYLYDDEGRYQNWSVPFYQKRIDIVEDSLIGLTGDSVYIYKIF
jgi:hypothetical protein